MTDLILASASPRRRALLAQIGVSCQVSPADICESVLANELPQDYTCRLALEKARHCQANTSRESIVLAADTTVSLDGTILGKPENERDAVSMLMQLSGRTHQVTTGIAVISPTGEDVLSVTSEVQFAQITEQMCKEYWQTGEPQDKAGSYGIQGFGAVFVTYLSGSYSNVVGLPLYETTLLLKRHGVDIWQSNTLEKEPVSG